MKLSEHHEKKAPFKLTAEAREPSKSTDEIAVVYDEAWTRMRSGHAERTVHCYNVTNVTKGGQYMVEFFEGDDGQPHGWDNCAASVVCKHIKTALKDLLQRVPDFGGDTFREEQVNGKSE